MMNNKGFTLIELVTTFAISTVIIIILMNTVLVIKNIYSNNNIKSELLTEQSNLSHLMNKRFSKDNLTSYTYCEEGIFCYEFDFLDSDVLKLVVDNDYIKFGSYVYKIGEGVTIGTPELDLIKIEVSNSIFNDSFLVIEIPITHKLYTNSNFGIKIVYQYNSKEITL